MTLISSLIETQEFATLPPIAIKVLNLLEDDEADIREISKIIETDATLTLKILRVANSPLYAIRQNITSIHQAIVNLGLNRLTNIVLGVSIFSRFLMKNKKCTAEILDKYWWHSSCTGVISKTIAKIIGKSFKEIEFLGGLLHDIGKLAMLQFDPVKFNQVIELIEKKEMMDVDAEIEIFGVDHLEVGKQIAKLWKLPEEIEGIIGNHNNPDLIDLSKELISIVRMGDLFCEMWGAGIYEGHTIIRLEETKPWVILTEINPELKNLDFEKFTFELEEEFNKAKDFLNIIST